MYQEFERLLTYIKDTNIYIVFNGKQQLISHTASRKLETLTNNTIISYMCEAVGIMDSILIESSSIHFCNGITIRF